MFCFNLNQSFCLQSEIICIVLLYSNSGLSNVSINKSIKTCYQLVSFQLLYRFKSCKSYLLRGSHAWWIITVKDIALPLKLTSGGCKGTIFSFWGTARNCRLLFRAPWNEWISKVYWKTCNGATSVETTRPVRVTKCLQLERTISCKK